MSSTLAHTAGIQLSGTFGYAGTQMVSPANGQVRNIVDAVLAYDVGNTIRLTVSNNATDTFVGASLDVKRIG